MKRFTFLFGLLWTMIMKLYSVSGVSVETDPFSMLGLAEVVSVWSHFEITFRFVKNGNGG